VPHGAAVEKVPLLHPGCVDELGVSLDALSASQVLVLHQLAYGGVLFLSGWLSKAGVACWNPCMEAVGVLSGPVLGQRG
jgi:hypothetical protein